MGTLAKGVDIRLVDTRLVVSSHGSLWGNRVQKRVTSFTFTSFTRRSRGSVRPTTGFFQTKKEQSGGYDSTDCTSSSTLSDPRSFFPIPGIINETSKIILRGVVRLPLRKGHLVGLTWCPWVYECTKWVVRRSRGFRGGVYRSRS